MIEFAAVLLVGAVALGLFVLRGPRGAGARFPRTGRTARRAQRQGGGANAAMGATVPPDVQLARLRRSGQFWGVMLRVAPGQACAAAQAARETRYPLERPPALPLPGCDSPQCRCGYAGLKELRRRDVLPAGSPDQRKNRNVAWDIYKS
jgi:hypothetical protein